MQNKKLRKALAVSMASARTEACLQAAEATIQLFQWWSCKERIYIIRKR